MMKKERKIPVPKGMKIDSTDVIMTRQGEREFYNISEKNTKDHSEDRDPEVNEKADLIKNTLQLIAINAEDISRSIEASCDDEEKEILTLYMLKKFIKARIDSIKEKFDREHLNFIESMAEIIEKAFYITETDDDPKNTELGNERR